MHMCYDFNVLVINPSGEWNANINFVYSIIKQMITSGHTYQKIYKLRKDVISVVHRLQPWIFLGSETFHKSE